jgi:septation ring formation regulator EzrA
LSNELQAMGFGLKELKLLRNTINETAEANKILADQAQQKFYKDIEEQYDDKLGFESQLNKLRAEIAIVNINLNISRTAWLSQPLLGPSLQRLFSKGVVEQDIIELANFLERSNESKGGNSTDTNELQKYGRIKFTIEQQADKLRNQIDELQRQKQRLDEQIQKDAVSFSIF